VRRPSSGTVEVVVVGQGSAGVVSVVNPSP
jgi:hypothetical protein